ncbi:hypothetical protein CBR_g50213 [Chara braunii]|uniref:Uncharacterized protein n=1 Tax=Chara braunii TaxID=69332 RepID=A0A388M6F5_CHABU|nr:hypothetical protein CBR_g50213 [Chara braunii]|eukprot:GBG90120.1 hypothetical protein CBR_g50213 [Chara braunii]
MPNSEAVFVTVAAAEPAVEPAAERSPNAKGKLCGHTPASQAVSDADVVTISAASNGEAVADPSLKAAQTRQQRHQSEVAQGQAMEVDININCKSESLEHEKEMRGAEVGKNTRDHSEVNPFEALAAEATDEDNEEV